MKIAFLGFAKIKYMPYMHFYLDQIDTAKHDVHLIYWKRDAEPDAPVPKNVTAYSFDRLMSDAIPLRKKLPNIVAYGSYARKKIKQLQPDFLVVMHSTTAITIYPLLMGKYKGRYIFDYRDVTYEDNGLYRSAVAKIIENSVLSFTSSDGFRKYLPDTPKLLTSHNLLGALMEKRQQAIKPPHTPIRVSFWGMIRHERVNRLIIEHLGGDSRFELHYYGRAQGEMLTMVQEAAARYDNVFFHGEYRPDEIPQLADKTDLLHNIYDNNDRTMPVAMANKYYEGVLFRIPLLSSAGSLMGNLCEEKGIGCACDPVSEDFADKLYRYYVNLNGEQYSRNSALEQERILREMEDGRRKIHEVLEPV